jgi:lipopolysaccharide transport system ATP-binding protein
LGMGKKEIDRKFDEIVAFAEIEKFIETPVKHYSSGMYVRLAFAVAAHLEPEILLVDEVLAVGDINFQKKCLGKMGEVAKGGRTVVLVSHQLNQIRRLCQRVAWVDGGRIRMAGGTHEVVSAYESAMSRSETPKEDGTRPLTKGRFAGWELVDSPPDCQQRLAILGPVTVEFTIEVGEPIRNGHHGIALFNNDQQLMWAADFGPLRLEVGRHRLRHTFSLLPLKPGPYSWFVTLFELNEMLDMWNCVPDMLVATENHQHPEEEWNGLLNLPSQFTVIQKN